MVYHPNIIHKYVIHISSKCSILFWWASQYTISWQKTIWCFMIYPPIKPGKSLVCSFGDFPASHPLLKNLRLSVTSPRWIFANDFPPWDTHSEVTVQSPSFQSFQCFTEVASARRRSRLRSCPVPLPRRGRFFSEAFPSDSSRGFQQENRGFEWISSSKNGVAICRNGDILVYDGHFFWGIYITVIYIWKNGEWWPSSFAELVEIIRLNLFNSVYLPRTIGIWW